MLTAVQELVPGFKEKIPEKRFETAAELSMHQRAKAPFKRCAGAVLTVLS